MRMTHRLTSVALAVATAAVAHPASAQTAVYVAPPPGPPPGSDDAVNRPGGTVAAIAGFAFGTCTGCGAAFGFGVEGGYTLPMHLYLGGNFTYTPGTVHTLLVEPQVGYDLAPFGDKPILIRP